MHLKPQSMQDFNLLPTPRAPHPTPPQKKVHYCPLSPHDPLRPKALIVLSPREALNVVFKDFEFERAPAQVN